ncbi:MAG: hypothetical protein AB7T38_02970 [Nitrospirales bacterium]
MVGRRVQRKLLRFFLEEVPDDSLSSDDMRFLGYVQEMLDSTGADITEEERGHGWMSNEEYVIWVKKGLEKFLVGQYDPKNE